MREVKSGCKTVAYNKDGSALAAGLVDGTVVVLETKKLNVICERRTHEAAISDVKFSPDGRFLATTCVDGSLDVYDSQNDYELTGTARTREGAALTDARTGEELLGAGLDVRFFGADTSLR